MCFARIAEEVFPFVYYLRNASRLKVRSELPALLQDEAFRGYDRLPVDDLDRRLAEEHERAMVLDDKTLKVTLFLSAGFSILGLGLTVISSSSSLLAKPASSLVGPTSLTLLFGVSVLYFILASWTALGAVRTYRKIWIWDAICVGSSRFELNRSASGASRSSGDSQHSPPLPE